jgi:hypothetical protein
MFCQSCKTHYCLYCRTVIVDDGKFKSDGRAAHDHVFDCQKAPPFDLILSSTVLYPVGSDPSKDHSDFLDAFLKVQKLQNLAVQIQKGSRVCKSVHLV